MPDLVLVASIQLQGSRLEVIALDMDMVTSTMAAPGSNAFVTRDWMGRMFFDWIL